MSRVLVALLAFSVLAVYVRFYSTPSKELDILQFDVADCGGAAADRLLERQLVVLTGRPPDEDDARLADTVFAGTYCRREPTEARAADGATYLASARFTLLSTAGSPPSRSRVDVRHPRGAVVRVVVGPGQTLVVPAMWQYVTVDPCLETRLHDTFSLLFGSTFFGKPGKA